MHVDSGGFILSSARQWGPDMRDEISAALKEAMRAQDKRRTSTLRLMAAAIKDREIAARTAGRDPIQDADVTEILMKMIKQRLESARLYEEGNRLDLAEQEREEIAIIRSFLPEQMDEDQVRSVCAETVKADRRGGPARHGQVHAGAQAALCRPHGLRQGEHGGQDAAHLSARRHRFRRHPNATAVRRCAATIGSG